MSGSSTITVDAILFDMDGTLVDSTPAVEATYRSFSKKHDFVIPDLPHGIRTKDNMRNWFPDASEERLDALVIEFEADIVKCAQELEASGKTGLIILPGVERVLSEIRSNPAAEDHYAICTSATIVYASSALKTTNITPPTHFITAEDCVHGKPHPEPYLNGAKAVKKDIKNCLVVEDAPSGIKSGLAAGATVLAVCTSHNRAEVEKLGAHFVVDNLESVSISWTKGGQMSVKIPA